MAKNLSKAMVELLHDMRATEGLAYYPTWSRRLRTMQALLKRGYVVRGDDPGFFKVTEAGRKALTTRNANEK